MLNSKEVIECAKRFLLKNNYPIKNDGTAKFPKDRNDPEAIEHFRKNNIASVSFPSIYLNKPEDPSHELDPGIYIVYVNYVTGEVHMPPHM